VTLFPNRPLKHQTVLGILIALLFVAAILRFYRLNEGLWLDEIITDVNYARLSFIQNITTFDSENQHFLYSLLANLFFSIFGESNWVLRLPAALFGIASIAGLFLLGREVSNDIEALLASALLTFSYHHIWFSQNARGYTGLLFWTILASWLFIRALEDDRVRTWLFFGVSIALGVYTHLTMVFVIIGQLLIYLFNLLFRRHNYHPARWIGFWIGFGVGGLLVLLFLSPVMPQILRTVGGSEQSVVTAWKNPLWTVLEIIRGLEIGFEGIFIAISALILFGIGLYSYLQSKPVMLGLLIIPALIGAASVIIVGHHLWPRFFFFAIGFGALVLVRGVIRFGQLIVGFWLSLNSERKTMQVSTSHYAPGVILCIGLILASASSIPRVYGPKQDCAGALDFIEKNRRAGDEVVTVSLSTFIYHEYYHTDWIDVNSLDGLDEIRAQSNRTWLVYTFPTVLESLYPDLMTDIQADFRLIKQFGSTVEQGDIYIYRADNPAK
jgi:mannosyltransferase